MTTDASPSRGGQQQPMLASQRAQEQQSGQPEDKPRSTGRTGPYFPLGYKEAAQQWVSSSTHLATVARRTGRLTR